MEETHSGRRRGQYVQKIIDFSGWTLEENRLQTAAEPLLQRTHLSVGQGVDLLQVGAEQHVSE